jgi:hypothetical protein
MVTVGWLQENDITMTTRNIRQKQTDHSLGKKEMSSRQMESFLVDLANSLDDDDSIRRLMLKYAWMSESLRYKAQAWLLVGQVQAGLRAAWDATDLRRREWFIFEARRAYHWSTVIDPIETAMLNTGDAEALKRLGAALSIAQAAVPDLTPFERVAYHFHRIAERARRCGNPECPAPYFFARKKGQKYCSSKCSAPSQRDQKRRWWREHRGKNGGLK